jgi:hypothetical protein
MIEYEIEFIEEQFEINNANEEKLIESIKRYKDLVSLDLSNRLDLAYRKLLASCEKRLADINLEKRLIRIEKDIKYLLNNK